MQNITQKIMAAIVDIGPLPAPNADSARIQVVLSALFGTLGAICLLVITIAGFRYVVSHGDPNVIGQAKQTILYAVIGLVICLSAIAIVSFVAGSL